LAQAFQLQDFAFVHLDAFGHSDALTQTKLVEVRWIACWNGCLGLEDRTGLR